MISLANIPLLYLFWASSLRTGKKKIFNENEFCQYFWISELFYQVCIQPLQSYYTFFTSHMGADCAPCVSVKKDPRMASGDHSNYPDDLHTYESQSRQNLAKIKFNGLLYNIKIINWAKNAVSLKFQIPGVTQVLLPRKTKQSDINEIKWVLKQNFDFIVDEYQLRLKFLHITVTDDSNKIIQNLKINLYKIATGPYHNDFSICGSKYNTRLQFDLKLSQYVQMNIDCEQTEAEICKKQYPGQSFYFTIRVLREEKQQPFQSTPSYKHSKPYLDTKKSQIVNSKYDQCPSPIRIRGRAPPKVTKNSSSFFWSSEKGDLPHFKIYLKSSQIQKTILHLVIWRTQSQIDIDDDSNTSSQDEDMFCEAYTPITRILQKDPVFRSDSSRNLKIEERVISLQKQGLWSDGQKIGEFSMKLKIQNNIFIKQMKACARTQSGIVLSIPFFGTYGINGKNEKNTVRFAQVKQIMVKIQNLNKQLNQNKKLSSQNTQKIKLSMSEQFNKMKKFFEDDEENSYFVPNNQSEALKMMDDQSLLLSVIQQIFYFIEDDQSLTDICWRIILAIIRRGQFNLNNIGFNKNDLNEIKKGVSSFYQKKIKIGLQYQELFFKLLVKSLRTGYIQGRQDPRQPIQMFRALSYFRVPEYREVLLRKVVRNQDLTIEWNTNITDGDIQNLPEAEHMLLTQLDWQNYFYKPLESQKRSQSLIKQLVENIEGSLWLQQISKRGSTFFYFLYFLIFRLLELSKRIKFIKWQYFPGYNKLVRAFLYEMKNLKVERYPQSLIQTSINLLANEKLLNILVLIVFEKTNSNDCNGLMKGLDLISRYLNHFTKNKKLLPPTFNYVYFFKGIKIVIEGEFSFSIVKVLSIIFMNYQNFNVEFKKNLSLYLLGRSFFKLFLNWSFTIRNAFYHLLLLKIQRSTDIFDPESRKQFANKHQLMNQIKERYDQCFKILRNASRVENDNNIEFVKKHEKQLYKVLKRKLAIKKKNMMSNSTQKKKHNLKLHSLLVKRQSLKNGLSDKKVTNKYSLHQLMKNGQSERTYSMHVDSTVLKSCKQNFKSNYDNDEKESKQSKQSFHDSSRTKSDAYHNLDTEDWKDLNIKKTKKVRERKRSIFGNDDFDMREIDKKELQYLPIAIKQFDELDQAIRNYYIEKGTLPICELDIEVPIDQKEIKPDSADFEDWQSGLED